MNLQHLKYFTQLAITEHFTRTSELLNITQPTLTHAINELEKELGVPLFEKTGRNVILTQYGKQFNEQISQALNIIDQTTKEMQNIGKGAGLLRIGTLRYTSIQFLPELAQKFRKNYPDLEIQFEFSNNTGKSADLIDGLIKGLYDCVFCTKFHQSQYIQYFPVLRNKLYLITPKNHPLTKKKQINLSDTLAYPQIWFTKTSGLRLTIECIFGTMMSQVDIAYEVEEDESIAGLIAAGFGIGIVPELPVLDSLDIEKLEISDADMYRTFYLVTSTIQRKTPIIENFIHFVKNYGSELNKN